MSTDRAALLAGIREAPEDDAPRLVFADWLEDQGEAERGRFIRLQCQAARLPEWGEERDRLQEEAARVLIEHGSRWVGEPPAGLDNSLLERGFWSRLCYDVPSYLGEVERRPLHELAPVQSLRLTDLAGRLDDVLACPALAWVDSLELDREVDDAEVGRLARSPHLRGLRTLSLRSRSLTAFGVAALLAEDVLPGLRRLRLHLVRLGDGGLGVLARRPGLGRLTGLEMLACGFGSAGVAELVRSRHVRRLEQLELGGLHYHDRAANIGDGALEALARPRQLPALRELTLDDVQATPAAWRTLARSALAGRLRGLKIHQSILGEDDVEALFHDTRLTHLDSLTVGTAEPTPEVVGLLARSPVLAKVRKLDLSNNDLGPPGAASLAVGLRLPNLGELALDFNRLGDEGIEALAASGHFPNLRRLDLAGNRIGPGGAERLARSRPLRGLTTLGLFNNSLGDAGAEALEDATFSASLRTLWVGANHLTAAGVARLVRSPRLARLRRLALNESTLAPGAVEALLEPSALPSLEALTLEPGDLTEGQIAELRRRFGPRLYLLTDADYA
jgi:uncharacterized protein (TIGR02996 family)